MENILVIAIIILIIGLATAYIVKSKKKGIKCVGCPYAETCSKNAEKGSCDCGK